MVQNSSALDGRAFAVKFGDHKKFLGARIVGREDARVPVCQGLLVRFLVSPIDDATVAGEMPVEEFADRVSPELPNAQGGHHAPW